MINRSLSLLWALFCSLPVFSQYYNLGQDPASVHWRTIKTDNFRLIYPEAYEKKAQELTGLFEYVYIHGTKTLGHQPRFVPVVIHTSDIIPNAYSVWTPKRLELYTCTPQNTYSQNWMEQLVIHEFRHAVQMDMLNKGFTKGLTWVFGEHATAAVSGLFVPMWFMEGDAVCTETALSHSGRGRVPSFEMDLRAQVIQKGIYSYDKAVFGSYRDFIPDQYSLGYQIVSLTRKNFGYKSWISAMDVVGRKPFLINPFNVGLKKVTGMNKNELYKSSLKELDSLWKEQASKTILSPFTRITRVKGNEYTRYKFPHYLNDSLWIAERTGLNDISRFVIIDKSGNEKILFTPGFFSSENFSVNSGSSTSSNKPGSSAVDCFSLSESYMTWTERDADPRWQNRNYSVIKVFEYNTGKIRKLTHKSRYFAPALSPSGKTLVAVSVDLQDKASLIELDFNTGKEIRVLFESGKDFIMNPSWSPSGEWIVFMLLNQHGKQIQLINTITLERKTVLPPTFSEISNPTFAGKYILFNGSYSGIENIYALDTTGSGVFQVTSSAFGSCNGQYNHNRRKLVYSEYDANGYSLVETDFDPARWISLENIKDNSHSVYNAIVKEETGMVDSTAYSGKTYESKAYHKGSHLFNFHSWAPAYFNYMTSESNTGVSFMSQNLLSTATTIIGYEWDLADKTGKYNVSFKWEGWYPVLDVDASFGKGAGYHTEDEGTETRYTWNETRISGGLKIPLLFNHGRFYSGIQLLAHTSYLGVSNNTRTDTIGFEGNIHSLDYRIYLSNFLKQGQKDLYPGWGQVLDFNFRHSPLGDRSYGYIGSAEAILLFPGLMRHHSIRCYAGVQQKEKKDYFYADLINIPRGYHPVVNSQALSFGINYKFPFLYPDLAIGPLFYFKRFKANLFYDHFVYKEAGQSSFLNSTGVEISTDMHILRFLLPFDLGWRMGYRFEDKKAFADMLFSINLSI